MLFPNDKKILKAFIKAQSNENSYVFMDKVHQRCYYCPFISHEYISGLTPHDICSAFKIPSGSVSASINYLIQEGYICRCASEDIYQVTYKGWNYNAYKSAEFGKLVVTHFLFPAAVAFVTTILTLLFLR